MEAIFNTAGHGRAFRAVLEDLAPPKTVGACGKMATVTELLPNLPDLVAALPAGAGAADVRELADGSASATTLDQLDVALAATVQRWLTA